MGREVLIFCEFVFLFVFLFFAEVTNGRELHRKIEEFESFNKHKDDNIRDKIVEPNREEYSTRLNESSSSNRYVENIELLAAYNSDTNTPGDYYGVMATLLVFGLQPMESGQTSGAFITVQNNKERFVKSKQSIIKVGWMINPGKYGDGRNRLFTYWQDGDSGCMDLDCKGFVVQSGSGLPPGTILEMAYDLTLKLFKEPDSGDWWVHGGTNGRFVPIGYFPNSLFSRLNDKATFVQFGGFVTLKDYLKSPPMGSGFFPDPNQVVGTIKNVRYIDRLGEPFLIQGGLFSRLDYKDCYGLGNIDTEHFQYGGPGGCKA